MSRNYVTKTLRMCSKCGPVKLKDTRPRNGGRFCRKCGTRIRDVNNSTKYVFPVDRGVRA